MPANTVIFITMGSSGFGGNVDSPETHLILRNQ